MNEDKKIVDFQWDEIEEETSDVPELKYSSEEIDTCVVVLREFVLQNVLLEYFAGIEKSHMYFSIPVDIKLHHLLSLRFSEEWSLKSRIYMFKCLYSELISEFVDSENAEKLNQKIQEVLPPSAKKNLRFTQVILIDEALSIGDSSKLSVEISLGFQANS